MWKRGCAVLGSFLGLMITLTPQARAGDLTWSGTIIAIFSDSGTGSYTGGVEGVTQFAGSVGWPDTCGATCTVEPFPPNATNYVFSDGFGAISGLGASSAGIESSIEIIDDEVVTQDVVELAALLGVTLTVGQTLDVWAVDSENAFEFTPDFVQWGVSYVYATSDPFSDTSFTPTPPPNPDFIIWEIDEDEEDAYAALGEVDSVPEPGGSAALLAGALALRAMARRRDESRALGQACG